MATSHGLSAQPYGSVQFGLGIAFVTGLTLALQCPGNPNQSGYSQFTNSEHMIMVTLVEGDGGGGGDGGDGCESNLHSPPSRIHVVMIMMMVISGDKGDGGGRNGFSDNEGDGRSKGDR